MAIIILAVFTFWAAMHWTAVERAAAVETCVLACLADDDVPITTEEDCRRWCRE